MWGWVIGTEEKNVSQVLHVLHVLHAISSFNGPTREFKGRVCLLRPSGGLIISFIAITWQPSWALATIARQVTKSEGSRVVALFATYTLDQK